MQKRSPKYLPSQPLMSKAQGWQLVTWLGAAASALRFQTLLVGCCAFLLREKDSRLSLFTTCLAQIARSVAVIQFSCGKSTPRREAGRSEPGRRLPAAPAVVDPVSPSKGPLKARLRPVLVTGWSFVDILTSLCWPLSQAPPAAHELRAQKAFMDGSTLREHKSDTGALWHEG